MSSPSTQPTTGFTVGDFVLVIAGGFAGALVGALVGLAMDDPGTLLVATLVGQYSGHLAFAALALRRRGVDFEGIGLDVTPSDGRYVLLGVGLQIGLVIAFTPLAQLLGVDESTQAITEMIPSVEGTAVRALVVLLVALVAPVVEEVMFRGFLYRLVEQRSGAGRAVWMSALVFALFHLLGITGGDALAAVVLLVPQLFLVGLVLGRQVRKSGRLGPAIFTHAGFNLVAVIALLLPPEMLQGV